VPETNHFGQPVGDPLVPSWTTRPRPEPVRLGGRYVEVVPLAAEHVPALHAAVAGPGDEPLWTYRATEMPATVEDLASLVARTLASPDLLTFAIVPAGRAAEGIASYTRIDPATGQVEVAGVLFARTLQQTTAATEAIHLLMRHAFETLGYRRFEWKCDSLNEPSRRAALRLGFRYEGRFRHHLVVKGRNRDTDWFSVTESEWPAVRAEHERWLDPANFDDAGRHRSRLSVAP
jgi:RimJ/RimL family protein N-acetyltransferase